MTTGKLQLLDDSLSGVLPDADVATQSEEPVVRPLATIKEYCGTMPGEARDEADRSYGWSAPTAR